MASPKRFKTRWRGSFESPLNLESRAMKAGALKSG